MIEMLKKLFDDWNILKQESHFQEQVIGIKERDIIFLRLGQNVGYEQDGKGEEFLRPVVVYKKFNKNMFLGIPLTTKKKENIYHFEFTYTNKRDIVITNSAIISQIKLFDTKRAKYKAGVIGKEDFQKLYKKIMEVTKPEEVTPTEVGEPRRDSIVDIITEKTENYTK